MPPMLPSRTCWRTIYASALGSGAPCCPGSGSAAGPAVSDSPVMLTADLLLFDLDLLNTIRNASGTALRLPDFKSLRVTALHLTDTQSRLTDGWVISESCSNLRIVILPQGKGLIQEHGTVIWD